MQVILAKNDRKNANNEKILNFFLSHLGIHVFLHVLAIVINSSHS